MLSAAVAALACLSLARCSPADHYAIKSYIQNPHGIKELSAVLASIDERLRVLDTITAVQAKQSRRLDVIQEKLDRVETTMSLKFDRAHLSAERLEHRLHLLQTSIPASIKNNNDKIHYSQMKVAELTQNLTNDIAEHRRMLEKANGAYADTWRRGLLLENMMRDGLSLVNATRRELADGLRGLARRQRDGRLNSAELDASFAKRLTNNTNIIDLKLQEVLDGQKRFFDTCQQRVQQDDPSHVANVLDKLIDSLINKTASTFKELQIIQTTMRNHDSKVVKLLNMRQTSMDPSCRRLETAFRDMSQPTFKETELQQLTEKFIALTDRADAALQRLEAKMASIITLDDAGVSGSSQSTSDIGAEADRLMLKLKGIKNEFDSDEDDAWDDMNSKYYDENDDVDDLMGKDRELLTGARRGRQVQQEDKSGSRTRLPAPARPPHRRHLHKHPYDRGPKHSPIRLP